MRLTFKDKHYGYGIRETNYKEESYDAYTNDKFGGNAFRKLGQLEDIEEMFGVEILTLFNALKNGVYYTNYGHGCINYCEKVRIIGSYYYEKKPNSEFESKLYGLDLVVSKHGLTLSSKTYGEFWALTKEELL